MPAFKRQNASPQVLQEWSTAIQFKFAEALPLVTSWSCKDAVFHGGTSLNMSWGSPRYSEDLDFLLNEEKTADLEVVMDKTLKRMQAGLMISHPGLTLELKNKTKEGNRLQHFQILASHPGYLEKAMVKVEFWKVDADYLKNYASEFVFPVRQGDVITRSVAPLPAATLEAAYADKLTAFATRPFLKWRDIFDLWWIDQQNRGFPNDIADRFLHHVSGYQTIDNLAPADALRAFLARENIEDVIKKADPDLKRWLPEPLWRALWPDGVRQMTETVFSRLKAVSDMLPSDDTSSVPSRRPKP